MKKISYLIISPLIIKNNSKKFIFVVSQRVFHFLLMIWDVMIRRFRNDE